MGGLKKGLGLAAGALSVAGEATDAAAGEEAPLAENLANGLCDPRLAEGLEAAPAVDDEGTARGAAISAAGEVVGAAALEDLLASNSASAFLSSSS